MVLEYKNILPSTKCYKFSQLKKIESSYVEQSMETKLNLKYFLVTQEYLIHYQLQLTQKGDNSDF